MYVYVSIPFSRTLYLNDTFPFSFLWGSLADHFGRKPILIVSATLMAICSFILAFSVSYVMTVAFRVVLGFCSGKCHVCTELPSVTAVGNNHICHVLAFKAEFNCNIHSKNKIMNCIQKNTIKHFSM